MASSLNILEGTVRVLIGAYAGATTPDVLPADTVAMGGSWGGTWRDVGFTTEAGVTINLALAHTPVQTSQDRNPVLQLRGASNDRFTFVLLEATIQNILDMTGRGTRTTVAPVGATPGYDQIVVSDLAAIAYVAIGVEGSAPPNSKGNPRRAFMPWAIATGQIAMTQRLAQAVNLPAEFMRMGGSGYPVTIHDVLTT